MASSSSSFPLHDGTLLSIVIGPEPFISAKTAYSEGDTIKNIFTRTLWDTFLREDYEIFPSFYFVMDKNGHACNPKMKVNDYLKNECSKFIRFGFISAQKNNLPTEDNPTPWSNTGFSPTHHKYFTYSQRLLDNFNLMKHDLYGY